MKQIFRSIVRDERGVSALEMALIAPFLIFGLLFMVDTGLSLSERMALDRGVRSGAQAAMSLNNSTAGIRDIVVASADTDDLSVTVGLQCSCPDGSNSCNTLCSSGVEPEVRVTISAEKDYAGFFSDNRLESSAVVRIR